MQKVKQVHNWVKKNQQLRWFEDNEVKQKAKKTKWLVRCQKGRPATRSDMYQDIIVSDRMFSEIFGDNIQLEPIVYGGIVISDNAKQFMMLPNKFKLFKEVDILEAETYTEECAAKQRWSYMSNDPGDSAETIKTNIYREY